MQEDKETSAKREVFGGLDAHMEVRTMQGVMYLNSARGFVPTAHAARRGGCALIVMCVTTNHADTYWSFSKRQSPFILHQLII